MSSASRGRYRRHVERAFLILATSLLLFFSTVCYGSSSLDRNNDEVVIVSRQLQAASGGGGGNQPAKPKTQPNSDNKEPPQKKPPLKLIWLASYPNSGKRYTRKLIQTLTQQSMATNYGLRTNALSPSGPFRLANRLPLPTDNTGILTETHCVGFCYGCTSGAFESEWKRFQKGCSLGTAFTQGVKKTEGVDYSGATAGAEEVEPVRKVVHLMRDPLDNIAARFHFEYETHSDKSTWRYEMNLNGFTQWCHDFDARAATQVAHLQRPMVAQLVDQVPCHGLFYQYALWHNNVYEMVYNSGNKIRELTVHLEDLASDKAALRAKTQAELLGFIGQEVSPEAPSESGNTNAVLSSYTDYYTAQDRVVISSYLKVLSTQETWKEIKRYLPYPTTYRKYNPVGMALSPRRYGKWPDVAWLLTYPNSGTGFTTALVQRLSRFVAATNYAHEVGDFSEDIPNFSMNPTGPFRYNKRPFPPQYILTKNHCAGHCIGCEAQDRVKDYDEFLTLCGRTWRYDEEGTRVRDYYHPSLAKRIVHLMRNPFDNIVANFHYEYKYQHEFKDPTWRYAYNKDGFRAWCRSIDEKDNYIPDKYYTPDMKNLAWSVPCHSIFYQYIQWHNHAFRAAGPAAKGGLDVPQLVIFYEDYQSDLDGTIKKLFDFLKLPRTGTLEPFELHSYPDYFPDTERISIKAFLKLAGSEETLRNLQRYF